MLQVTELRDCCDMRYGYCMPEGFSDCEEPQDWRRCPTGR